ncbi:amidohydrolase [Arthrobacter woluwensis]|uniref:amidohydrolase n=1 Tax=Arthrobacter woluwensis TaxID=156980 RepID=UPI000D138800|nr:amidohydrolase [Arthrobacter woluwensis]PSS43975.1 amidohydrolase [Arthrobacter woluwensis]
MARTLYHNALIFTANGEDGEEWAQALVVDDARIAFAGSEDDARAAAEGADTVDLGGRLVVPGFVDAHTHLLMTGEALGKVELTDARSLQEIQNRLRAAREADPAKARVLGRGWLFDSVPGGEPTAAMIDAAVADVPVYLDANDYHSCWVNTAALAELGITRETPDPIGGRIERDAEGNATGMLYETAAQHFVWTHLASVTSDAERDAAIDRTFEAYLGTGVTGAVDMALDEVSLATLERAVERHGGALPLRVAAHWFIDNTGDDAQNIAKVERAAELAARLTNPSLRVVGVKFIIDGVIDACTAAMNKPYADHSNAEPIWPLERLKPALAAADAAGLQAALHAIGDAASDIALDAIEHAIEVNGDRPRRHRIEHLEYAAPGTARRMAELGVIASMQPVHTDAAVRANWDAMLGDDRVNRGFAWPEYEEAGALLAFSTDAPTAPYGAFPNLYVATTRKSALDASYDAVQPELALPLARALGHATRDAAASVGDGATHGRLAEGYAADFVVVDVNPFDEGDESLLKTSVVETVVAGRSVYTAGE